MRLITSGKMAVGWLRCVVLASLVGGALVGFGFSQVAAADRGDPDCYAEINDKLVYICGDDDPGDGDEDGDGDGSGNDPSCDLSVVEGRSNPHCYGEYACWANIPSALDEDSWPDDAPSDDAVYIFRYCYDSDGNYYDSWWDWLEEDETSITDEAWQAYGELIFPEFTVDFSPLGLSLVDLDTWFWVDGPSSDPISGTSAGGVVAIATPQHIEVDPGDGVVPMTCEWAVSESDACAHVYQRASVNGPLTSDGGDPAYEARARLVFGIHFEFGGEVLELPGLPDEFVTDWQSGAVPVAEVQGIVTR